MLTGIKRLAKKSLAVRRAARWYVAHRGAHLDWPEVLHRKGSLWEEALKRPDKRPRVLIATSVGAFWPGTTLESILAVALTLREAEVHVLLCDGFLPACLECLVSWFPRREEFVHHGPQRKLCGSCFEPAFRHFRSLGLQVHRYSEFVTKAEAQAAAQVATSLPSGEIAGYSLEGVCVGEHAVAGALRFYARGDLNGEPLAEPVLRQYLKAALLTTYAARNLIRRYRFDIAVFHHGIYVPQGLIGGVARQEGVRVVNWNPAYRKRCFVFSHGDTYHHTLMREPVKNWEDMPWTRQMEEAILQYLRSRWQGTEDWIWFHEAPKEELVSIARELGVDFSRPCIGLLTNVVWDAQLHYPANAFSTMLDWLLKTIAYFVRRPDLQLLIRIHPAEIRGTVPSRQRADSEIRAAFPHLPPNIIIVSPESRVSTYALMTQCDSVLLYGTKTGVELTSMGIPVIVAGEAWIRNKGITMDAESERHYFELLDRLPLLQRLDAPDLERARKYAYHFFFRRMIPLDFLEPLEGNPLFRPRLSSVEDLLPGRCRGLDVVCEGILRGAEFIFPAEAESRSQGY